MTRDEAKADHQAKLAVYQEKLKAFTQDPGNATARDEMRTALADLHACTATLRSIPIPQYQQ